MKKSVLVIEDEPIIAEMMSILLEMEGYKVISLENTSMARKKLHNCDADLVILDLKLHGEDGSSMCSYIKSQPDLKSIPVILVSANADLAEIAKSCGADDYIAKPFQLKNFIEKIEKQYKNRIAA